MPQKNKMVTCTCGNTDLERLRLRLTGEDGRSLALVALLCRGDGCGRVTFRPQETPKTEGDHQLSKPANGNFTESAKVIEGAKFVEGAKLVEGARLIESAKVVESDKLVESAHVTEGARLIEAPKKTEVAKNDVARSEGPKGVAALFERVYTERLVYKAIAERDPNCPTLFDALKRNEQICSGINAAFGQVYQRIEENEDLLAALQSLPSLAGQG